MDECRHQSFSGLFRFTYRIWRANLVPLLAVGLLASAIALLAASLIEGTHSFFSFSGNALGIGFYSGSDGSGVRLDTHMFATGLTTIAASAWASATMVVMLLGHLRHGRRASPGDLGCGLRCWGWVALAALLVSTVEQMASLLQFFWLGFSPFFILVVLFVTVALASVFVFYVQEIADARRNSLTALGASWRLVRRAGYWRVFGNLLLFGLCLLPLLVAENLLISMRYSGWAGPAAGQLLTGMVEASLVAAFTTVLYLVAGGDREQVKAVLGPAGRDEGGPQPYRAEADAFTIPAPGTSDGPS